MRAKTVTDFGYVMNRNAVFLKQLFLVHGVITGEYHTGWMKMFPYSGFNKCEDMRPTV